jgi:hypothetical protein
MFKKITAVFLFSLSLWSINAIALSEQEVNTLSAAIYAETDPEFVAYRQENKDYEMAIWLNQPSTFIAWVTNLTQDEIMQSPDFNWTRVDNLSVGKARIWDWMFDNSGTAINCANQNIRTGIESVWVGTAADLAVRAGVIAKCKRFAKRVERYFATGTGTYSSPGILGYEGDVSVRDVANAMRFDDGTPRQ